jgi:clan AA aspartic protease (TIGR02281 family)
VTPRPAPITSANAVPLFTLDGNPNHLYLNVSTGMLTLPMLLDTGCDGVALTQKEADQMVGLGDAEWLPDIGKVTVADGRTVDVKRVKIRTLTIGGVALHDVVAGVTSGESMLIGMSVLNQVGKFSIDTTTRQLVFS